MKNNVMNKKRDRKQLLQQLINKVSSSELGTDDLIYLTGRVDQMEYMSALTKTKK